jgi:tetratricopeptide (TPR) repeat protein
MMRNVFRQTFAALLLCASLPLAAATPNAFYASLLRRGISAFDAGRFEEAVGELRLAAFGSVESIESYETAQVYLTLSYDRLAQPDRAREAARKIVAAERVERRYTALGVPAAVRTAFEPVAAKLLTAAEMNTLRGGPPPPAAAPLKLQPTTAVPPAGVPVKPPSITTITVPMPETDKPKPAAVNPPPGNASSAVSGTAPQQTPTKTQTQTQPAKPAPAPATTTAPKQVQTPQRTPATPARTAAEPPKQAATTTPAQVHAQPPAQTPPVQKPIAQTTTTAPPPVTQPAKPAPVTVARLTAAEVASRLTAGERALVAANLPEARRIYRELLGAQGVDHDALLRVAEGLYRARDFTGALSAFQRLGPLRRGEEPYRYYVAVALYETGAYAEAKRELSAVLPFIEVTPDVQRYRTRIEGAVN